MANSSAPGAPVYDRAADRDHRRDAAAAAAATPHPDRHLRGHRPRATAGHLVPIRYPLTHRVRRSPPRSGPSAPRLAIAVARFSPADLAGLARRVGVPEPRPRTRNPGGRPLLICARELVALRFCMTSTRSPTRHVRHPRRAQATRRAPRVPIRRACRHDAVLRSLPVGHSLKARRVASGANPRSRCPTIRWSEVADDVDRVVDEGGRQTARRSGVRAFDGPRGDGAVSRPAPVACRLGCIFQGRHPRSSPPSGTARRSWVARVRFRDPPALRPNTQDRSSRSAARGRQVGATGRRPRRHRGGAGDRVQRASEPVVSASPSAKTSRP